MLPHWDFPVLLQLKSDWNMELVKLSGHEITLFGVVLICIFVPQSGV